MIFVTHSKSLKHKHLPCSSFLLRITRVYSRTAPCLMISRNIACLPLSNDPTYICGQDCVIRCKIWRPCLAHLLVHPLTPRQPLPLQITNIPVLVLMAIVLMGVGRRINEGGQEAPMMWVTLMQQRSGDLPLSRSSSTREITIKRRHTEHCVEWISLGMVVLVVAVVAVVVLVVVGVVALAAHNCLWKVIQSIPSIHIIRLYS